MIRIKKFSPLLVIVGLLPGCGGGGGASTPSPSTPNASPGGIWSGNDPISQLSTIGVVTETGEARFIRSDGAQFVGTATTSGNNLSGSYSVYLPTGYVFQDGSNHGTGTVSGTITARQSITATFQVTTANGNSSSGSGNFSFNSLYNSGSSLAAISGNYTDPNTGATISISGSGAIFSQDAVTGCVINGSVAIINSSYDVYSGSYSFSNCQGAYAHLNNTTATGLGILDTTASPIQAVIAVSNAAAGYVITEVLSKQ